MTPNTQPPPTLALFCKVIDNFGDIGICWRLARQLQHEHQIAVTLWVDDLASFQRICPQVCGAADVQQIAEVTVRRWQGDLAPFAVDDVADFVIEFFGCDIPPAYLAAMAARMPSPVWLNLEGLSAEEWVEGCHTLPSPHGQYSLTKYFFFPGFTPQTGGLLCESALLAQRVLFQDDPALSEQFLRTLGLTTTEIASFKVSLFCYPHAPVADLFDVWQASDTPIICLVPEGVASDTLQTYFCAKTERGAVLRRGALTVRILPFLAQPLYDQLLWSCDLNFVRGEDSFVRAQWANRPFVWHIYPQDKNLHHVKLNAFLARYASDLDDPVGFFRCWNGIGATSSSDAVDWASLWASFLTALPKITKRNSEWQRHLLNNGDLALNLMQFAARMRAEASK